MGKECNLPFSAMKEKWEWRRKENECAEYRKKKHYRGKKGMKSLMI